MVLGLLFYKSSLLPVGSADFPSEEEHEALLVLLLEAGNLKHGKRLGEDLEAMHEDVDHGLADYRKLKARLTALFLNRKDQ